MTETIGAVARSLSNSRKSSLVGPPDSTDDSGFVGEAASVSRVVTDRKSLNDFKTFVFFMP